MSVHDKMTAIADAIRGKTGSAEKLTLEGMAAAIAGITVGGGGMDGVYMAQVTPDSDVGEIVVEHGLGTEDILLAACWIEDMGGYSPAFNGSVLNVYLKSALPYRMSNTVNRENAVIYGVWNTNSANVSAISQPTSNSYVSMPVGANAFVFDSAGAASAKYFGGVTYTVLIVAASAFVPTEV
jgi:hypothetical protein